MQIVMTLLAGLIFGLGLAVSGLINPAKVLNFLDVTGQWDPSLLITMATAVIVTFVGYRLTFTRSRPAFGEKFQVPTNARVDSRLLTGAAIFGVGWGMVGYCPGPAIAGLAFGVQSTIVFVIAMLVGMAPARWSSAFNWPSLPIRDKVGHPDRDQCNP